MSDTGMTHQTAKRFAHRWVAAWNARDLDAILSHYAEDFEMSSPLIAEIGGQPNGVLRGKAAVGAYWRRALQKYPDARFQVLAVYAGARSIVIRYRTVLDMIACETLEFDASGKVTRAAAHYNEDDVGQAAEHRAGVFTSHLTPILNVSDVHATFAWFEQFGWRKCWGWPEGKDTTFGAVGSGECEIFLCLNGQGGRGRGNNTSTGGIKGEDDTMDKGVWMSLWVEDVDTVHARCKAAGLDVTMPPTDEPWGVREMHVRHPDGHVFRVSKGHSEHED